MVTPQVELGNYIGKGNRELQGYPLYGAELAEDRAEELEGQPWTAHCVACVWVWVVDHAKGLEDQIWEGGRCQV